MATSLRPTLAEALAREYRFEVIPDAEGGYVIRYPELPGCMTQVESLEEVPAAAREIRELWLETEYERNGEPADGTATDEGRPPNQPFLAINDLNSQGQLLGLGFR